MEIRDTVRQINGAWFGVLVNITNNIGYVKTEWGDTIAQPLASLRYSAHVTRYTDAEINRAVEHYKK